MKIISLETIAAMQAQASDYEARSKRAKQAARGEAVFASEVGTLEDAKRFDLIARELREVAEQKAHERAYATARWITNANSGIRPADARAIAAAIEATPHVEKINTMDVLPGDKGVNYQVRLVYYYDPTTKINRWALEYTNDKDRPAISDNESEEDARFRYREFIGLLSKAR